MSYGWVIFPAFIGAAFGAGCILRFRRREVQLAVAENYRSLRERLGLYAQMKSSCAVVYHPPASNVDFVPSCFMLNAEQHDILLGVLKKIEAKSAAVAVVFVLAFDVMATNLPEEFCLLSEVLWGFACGLLASMLVASLDAASHLGQRHFRKMRVVSCIKGRELQRALMHDALKKEGAFSAFYLISAVVMVCIGLAYLLNEISTW